jgi:hypothetical protein
MARHLDEMQSYIQIASGAGLLEAEEEIAPEPQPRTEAVANTATAKLLESLGDVVFKLRSYTELNEDQSYALGVEEGLSLAAEILDRVIDKYRLADENE